MLQHEQPWTSPTSVTSQQWADLPLNEGGWSEDRARSFGSPSTLAGVWELQSSGLLANAISPEGGTELSNGSSGGGSQAATPLTPPDPSWPAALSSWSDTPQRGTVTIRPQNEPAAGGNSPWARILAPHRSAPIAEGCVLIVHPTGAKVEMAARWDTATVRDARNAAAVEWCLPLDSFALHCSNDTRLSRCCRGTALSDATLLSQCASAGDELFAVPFAPADHCRDPSQNRAIFLRKPLPERLAHAAVLLPALAERAADCSLLQKELDVAVDLGHGDWCDPVVEAVSGRCSALLTHHCGNYLLRRCVEGWPARLVPALLQAVRGRAVEYACHRHASYVLQSCMHHALGSAASGLVMELLKGAERLAADSFGNYVLQTAIDECPQGLLHTVERALGSLLVGHDAQAVRLRRKLRLHRRTHTRASERGVPLAH